MPRPRAFRELRLLNGSTGDPCLFGDDQGRDNALLIDIEALAASYNDPDFWRRSMQESDDGPAE